MGFLYRTPIKLTLDQSVKVALLDAWLDEFSGIVARATGGEPNYRVLSRLWPDREVVVPDELFDKLRQ